AEASVMVGNSSSGILEAASFKLPVVNIGDRQAGRERAANVIDVPCEKAAIQQGLQKALSVEFKQGLASLTNPYGDGQTAGRIVDALRSQPWHAPAHLLKKPFFEEQLSSRI